MRRAPLTVAALIALAALSPAIVVLVATSRMSSPLPERLPDEFGASGEVFELPVGDCTQVNAWWIPTDRAVGTMVMLHGYAHHKSQLLPHIRWARALGYDVLAISLRAHGASDGWRHDIGVSGVLETRAAIAEAARRRPNQPIYGLGFSMGAGLLLSLGAEPGLRAIIALAPYRDLGRAATVRVARFLPAPLLAPMMAGVSWWAERLIGVRPDDIAPARRLVELPANLPVLLAVGARDWKAPADDVAEMARSRPGTRLHVVPGAAHDDLWDVGQPALGDALAAFLRET